jgi:general secretion pathway protein D
LKLLICLCLALGLWGQVQVQDNRKIAANLARLANKAANSSQTVRAYLLFSEAAARDPRNPSYRANRDALAPLAKLLTAAKIESADIASDVLTAENEAAHPVPPIERVSSSDWESQTSLKPIPHVQENGTTQDFDLRIPAKALVIQVAQAYGVHALADADLTSATPIRFNLQGADFKTALEAVTAATHTFVFPVDASTLYFAPDTEVKRNELEPVVALTFPLQEALTERDLIDAANAVRGLLGLRTMGWDSLNRTVVIRDKATRAQVARSLMESLLLPRAQLSFEVQFLTLDTDKNYHYGMSLQTLFQFIYFGEVGGLNSVLPKVVGSSVFGVFGGGATIFGVGIADAMAFASVSKSISSSIFDATVVVADRQTADFHIGDKYPIASSLYTGFPASTGSIYNPAPQITMEDLGLVLKITPHVNGDGDIAMDLEAEFKSLGNQTYNTVPAIAQRAFKGRVSLREGQWAIIAGLDSSADTFSRNGLAGIGQIPGLKQLLTENKRDTQTSKTLLVIKPTITRLPVSDVTSPQYLLGARRGNRVVL